MVNPGDQSGLTIYLSLINGKYEDNFMISRDETASDQAAVYDVNSQACGQNAEARLVDELRIGEYVRISILAENNRSVIGHILFSELPILSGSGTIPALALAPLAVRPVWQNRGVGSALPQPV